MNESKCINTENSSQIRNSIVSDYSDLEMGVIFITIVVHQKAMSVLSSPNKPLVVRLVQTKAADHTAVCICSCNLI